MTNAKLHADLTCPGDGLIIGADGRTVDLNGHVLTGSGSGVAITVRGRRVVVVVDGMVRGFTTQNLVLENILIDNPSGILLFDQSGNTLNENSISGSTVAAIELAGPGASGNLLKENRLTSSSAGIKFSSGWTGNRIIENQIERNTCGLQGAAEGNTFEENLFSANGLDWCS